MIVTVNDLKNLYGMPFLTPAAEMQYENLLATAEEEVLAYAGIGNGEATERFDGNGASEFVLVRHPVKEVVAVTVNGEEVAYEFDDHIGRILLSSPAYGKVKVVTKLGYDEYPRVIKQCIALTVQYWSKLINSNMIGVTNRNNDMGGESLEQYEIPLAVKTSLDRFRTVAI